ncbi:MAG: ATP-grasp domain-containing protein [Candidatus Omnitrophica bacterium]|nr:ATP-grasp domain-containing protein [Candidatus Omnitrophota bacterium]
MKKAPRVLIAFDTTGPSAPDQDFSEEFKTKDWQTEANVVNALKQLEYPYDLVGIYDDIELLIQKIKLFKPDIIFNLVEHFKGSAQHERDITAFLKLQGIPFTGCGPTGITLCKDKGLSKQILGYHRIRVPQFVILPYKKRIHRPKRLKFPVFIKPLSEEASCGISQSSFVENDVQFRERVEFIHNNLQVDVIAEEYIEGRELYVSIIGNKRLQVLPIRELKFLQVPEDEPKIATYKAKWDDEYRKKWGIRNQFAGSLPNGSAKKIEKVSKKIYQLLSIRGYARLDLRLNSQGELYFIEANPNPMLAAEEDFAQSAEKAGLDYPALIQKIISLADPLA